MKQNIFKSMVLMTVATLSLTACQGTDPLNNPDDMVTLNMKNEDNGKTIMGTTDIYLTRDNNLYSPSQYYIMDFGQVLDLGHIEQDDPIFNTLTDKAAVSENEGFIAIHREDALRFPSTRVAIPTGSTYYRIWCDGMIEKDGDDIGATMNFALYRPKTYNLPDWHKVIGTIDQTGGQSEMNLLVDNGDCEAFFSDAADDLLTCQIAEAGKKYTLFTLSINPYVKTTIAGRYTLNIRCCNSYTTVYLYIK